MKYSVTVPVEINGMVRDFNVGDVQYDGPMDAEGIAKVKEAARKYAAEHAGVTLVPESEAYKVKIYRKEA